MRSKSLLSLYGSYVNRCRALDARLTVRLPANLTEAQIYEPVHRDGFAFLVVRLQHLWGEFCRELVVRSAMGGCFTRTGQNLPAAPGAKHVRDLPGITRLPFAGRGTYWEEPNFVIRQARRLSVTNHLNIDLGVSSASVYLAELKTVRNFVTHPNRETAATYAQLAASRGLTKLPPEHFLRLVSPGGATTFETWTQRLTIAAWNAVA